jgi:hypothetical protein
MPLLQHITIAYEGTKPLLETLAGYLVRYRLALYGLGGAIVAAGIVLDWNWITVAGLLRIVTVLPCTLMMYRCMNCGPRKTDQASES